MICLAKMILIALEMEFFLSSSSFSLAPSLFGIGILFILVLLLNRKWKKFPLTYFCCPKNNNLEYAHTNLCDIMTWRFCLQIYLLLHSVQIISVFLEPPKDLQIHKYIFQFCQNWSCKQTSPIKFSC